MSCAGSLLICSCVQLCARRCGETCAWLMRRLIRYLYGREWTWRNGLDKPGCQNMIRKSQWIFRDLFQSICVRERWWENINWRNLASQKPFGMKCFCGKVWKRYRVESDCRLSIVMMFYTGCVTFEIVHSWSFRELSRWHTPTHPDGSRNLRLYGFTPESWVSI